MPLSKDFLDKVKSYIDGLKKLTEVEKRNFFTIITRILNNIYEIFIDVIKKDIKSKSPKYNKPHSVGNIVDIILKKIPTTDYSYIMALSGKRQFENLYKPLIQSKLDIYSSNLADYYRSATNSTSVTLEEFIERGIFTAIVSFLVELQDLTPQTINSYLKEANAETLLRIKSTNETNTSRVNTRRRPRVPNIAAGAAGAAGTGLSLTRHQSRSGSGSRSGSRSGSESNGSNAPFNKSPSKPKLNTYKKIYSAYLKSLNGSPFQTHAQHLAALNAAIRHVELHEENNNDFLSPSPFLLKKLQNARNAKEELERQREEIERQREEMERQRKRNEMERERIQLLETRMQENARHKNIGPHPERPPF